MVVFWDSFVRTKIARRWPARLWEPAALAFKEGRKQLPPFSFRDTAGSAAKPGDCPLSLSGH
eukprot:1586244-Pyramimonas_sp.AAC.1